MVSKNQNTLPARASLDSQIGISPTATSAILQTITISAHGATSGVIPFFIEFMRFI